MNEYLFEYHFAGSTWGIRIHADSASQAREKIKAVGMAAYRGEVAATIKLPRWRWLCGLLGQGTMKP
jgi:hypothetical protein